MVFLFQGVKPSCWNLGAGTVGLGAGRFCAPGFARGFEDWVGVECQGCGSVGLSRIVQSEEGAGWSLDAWQQGMDVLREAHGAVWGDLNPG